MASRLCAGFPHLRFPKRLRFRRGERIVFKTPMGDIDAKIVELGGDEAVIDLNHECAGRSATFDIELVALVHESAIHRELHPAGCACGCGKLKAQIG